MAAPIISRVVRNTSLLRISQRQYTTRAPIELGGKSFEKIKNEPGPDVPTYEERMSDLNRPDPDISQPVNIGEKYSIPKQDKKVLLEKWKKKNDMEQAARLKKLEISLEDVRESWCKEHGPLHVQKIAEHYGIYRDLFNDAFFVPTKNMRICYEFDEDYVTPVHRGNKIPPAEASTCPIVEFESDPDQLYTLVMTNPDGHLTDNESEYLHWFVGNIPGDDLSKGEIICDYLRPFPPKGTGYHRHVFILYKQEKHINYNKEKRSQNCTSLAERTFQNLEFYREYQDVLTPVGLNFFQSEWDHSVREVYHDILDMKEPSFEYAFEPWYIAKLKKYPHKEPFDRYYDRYRDKKDISEEVLKMKLKMVSPFEEYKRPMFPLVHRDTEYKPSWLKKREELMHRRLEQYEDLP